jgi:hypothetical protein
MAYDLNQFIADCRDILARDPGPAANRSASISSDCWPTRILSKNIVVPQCHAD